jgi:hypothetical protein
MLLDRPCFIRPPYSGVTYAPERTAVNQEGRGVDVRRLVGGEEECGVGDLDGLGKAAHRQVDEPTGCLLRVFGEELLQERRVHRAGAERVDADALAGELDAELAAHGEDAAF